MSSVPFATYRPHWRMQAPYLVVGTTWWGYVFFLAAAALLFVRPSELLEALEPIPLYEIAIAAGLLASAPTLLRMLTLPSLAANPISILVLGMLPALILACVLNGDVERGVEVGIDFAKVCAFYFLMVAALSDAQRYGQFLSLAAASITVGALLSTLAYHGVIDVPALAPLLDGVGDGFGGQIRFTRLRGAGLFNDPNDTAMIHGVGMILGVHALLSTSALWKRLLWLGALAVQGHALMLTQSRGGFLAFTCGMLVLLWQGWGAWRTALVGGICLPVTWIVFEGRQTDITLTTSTGQSRIQLWSDGLAMLRSSPLFGVGEGAFLRNAGQVAHNSFLQAFAELGLVGGGLFLGAWGLALWGLWRLGRRDVTIADPNLARMRPYVLAAVAAYAVGMLSLSRTYVVPTYLVLAMAPAYFRITAIVPRIGGFRANAMLLVRIVAWSLAFLAATYVFVRLFLRWG